MLIPYVTEGNKTWDVFSRLLQDRVILLTGEINDDTASSVVAQMLFLEAQDPQKDIYLYINSPGGSVTAGLAILDTMSHISCDVVTIGIGMVASMGSVLLAGGTAGKRRLLPHAEVMIHQALGSAGGQTTDVLIHAKRLERINEELTEMLARFSGKPKEMLQADMQRDRFMTAEEAVKYGLADEVLRDRREAKEHV